MSASDPAWLQGLTPSPCSALAWENHDQRQFCVLPFYPNGNRDDLQRYAMRGRALSNGESYPVPPSTYRLDLVQCNPDPDGTDWYQWNAQARGRAPYIVPIEMHKIRAEEYGRDPDGTRSWISKYPLSSHLNSWKIGGDMILVSHSGPTEFYPDVSLWSSDLLIYTMGDDWFPEPPSAMGERWDERPVALVETHLCPIFKQSGIRGPTARLWDRERRPTA